MITFYHQTSADIPNSIPPHLRTHDRLHEASGVPYMYFRTMLDSLGIEYNVVTKENYNNEPAWYNMEIGWIDQALVFQNIFENIDKDVLELIKNQESNLKLLIFFPTEGFSLTFPRFMDLIDFCLKDKDIPFSKVRFVFGDLNIEQNYKLFAGPMNKGWDEDLKTYGMNCFEYNYWHECDLLYWSKHRKLPEHEIAQQIISEQEFEENWGNDREKMFLFKNANPRKNRIYFASELLRMGVLEHGYVSFLNRYYTPSVNAGDFDEFRPVDNLATEEYAKKFLDMTPIVIDHDADTINEGLNQRYLVKNHFTQSYFSLVMETTFENCEQENVMFLTEKVYQPMLNYHPFMIAGNTGILECLKADGYATFPELFNESYDTVLNKGNRANILLQNMFNICCNQGIQYDFLNIYKSQTVKDKLIHNRNLFMQGDKKKKWLDCIQWINNS